MIRSLIFLCVLFLASMSVKAQYMPLVPQQPNPFNNITVRGPGGLQCGAYTQANPLDKNLFVAWAQGFFSAYNTYVQSGGDIARNMTSQQLMSGLDNYCRTYPMDSFQNAVAKLLNAFRASPLP